MPTVLVVDGIQKRRDAVRGALKKREVQTHEVSDAYAGLAAIGQSTYSGIIIAEGKRQLSVKSLCALALRRHNDVPVFLILRKVERAREVRQELGPRVLLVPPEWGVEQLCTRVAQSCVVLPPEFKDAPPPEGPIVLEGEFEEEAGPALLIGLFVQELSGRLAILEDGTEKATIYFRKGEPVWAIPEQGDTTVFRRMVRMGLVPRDLAPSPVPDGELLLSLVRKGTLTKADVKKVMVDVVRDEVLNAAARRTGNYVFVEDAAYESHEGPGLSVNPFGLIFEVKRRSVPPQEIMEIGQSLGARRIFPGPGLGMAKDKIRPFLRGGDATEALAGETTVQEFCDRVGLDPVMGSLLVLSLVEARLARLGAAA